MTTTPAEPPQGRSGRRHARRRERCTCHLTLARFLASFACADANVYGQLPLSHDPDCPRAREILTRP